MLFRKEWAVHGARLTSDNAAFKGLNQILEFFDKFRVNPHKTQAITFTRKMTEITNHITVHGHQIPWDNKVKYFGIIRNKRITWAMINARATIAYPALKRLYPLTLSLRAVTIVIQRLTLATYER